MKHTLFRSRLKILAVPLISALAFSANAHETKSFDDRKSTAPQEKEKLKVQLGRPLLTARSLPPLTPEEKDLVRKSLQRKEDELERGVGFLMGSGGKKKDFKKGLKILDDLGRSGNGRAYTALGQCFVNGSRLHKGNLWFKAQYRDCVNQIDFERANTFFKKAALLGDVEGQDLADQHPEVLLSKANQGDTKSQVLLGTGYLWGAPGFEKNIQEAVKWYEKAGGEVSSCDALGRIYRGVFDGFEGVDHARAVEWFHKAEKMGSGYACFYLALHYANGDGVPQDREKARYYAEGARKYWIGGSLDILNALSNTPSDQRIENPRKDAVMIYRNPVPALGQGDRY